MYGSGYYIEGKCLTDTEKALPKLGSACFLALFHFFHILQAFLTDVLSLEGGDISCTPAEDTGVTRFVFAQDDAVIIGKDFQCGSLGNI